MSFISKIINKNLSKGCISYNRFINVFGSMSLGYADSEIWVCDAENILARGVRLEDIYVNHNRDITLNFVYKHPTETEICLVELYKDLQKFYNIDTYRKDNPHINIKLDDVLIDNYMIIQWEDKIIFMYNANYEDLDRIFSEESIQLKNF